MSVKDLWEGLPKNEIKARRAAGVARWQRRWYGPDLNPKGRPREHKRNYPEAQKAQAYMDDAAHKGTPKAKRLQQQSVTVRTLMERHLEAISDRKPKTVEANNYHAAKVLERFGDSVVTALIPTEIEVWSQRPGVAAESRKKQLEILRACIKRAIRDKLIDTDVTDGIVVSLPRSEQAHYTSDQLNAIVASAASLVDQGFLAIMGFMGLREGEVRHLEVRDVTGETLVVRDPKTPAGRRILPIPEAVKPVLTAIIGDRSGTELVFDSPRLPG